MEPRIPILLSQSEEQGETLPSNDDVLTSSQSQSLSSTTEEDRPPPLAEPGRYGIPHRADPSLNGYVQDTSRLSQHSSGRQTSRAPIAEVLNDVAPRRSVAPPQPAALQHGGLHSGTQPFSGRLEDLLHQPELEVRPHRFQRLGDQPPGSLPGPTTTASGTPATVDTSANPLTLPKLPPKQPQRRPSPNRIPPVLQGLHQVPPLSEGRLFPPITSETRGFGDSSLGRGPPGNRHSAVEITVRSQGLDRNGVPKEQQQPTLAEEAESHDVDLDGRSNAKGKRSYVRGPKVKWTEDETEQLLLAVSKYGVGNWKKILDSGEFKFGNRTHTDLKDRFRTCCPDMGLKSGRPSRAKRTVPASVSLGDQSTISQAETASRPVTTRAPRRDKQQRPAEELANLGITEPFARNTRRKLQPYTEVEDANLLKGYNMYRTGNPKNPVSWRKIKHDPALGFADRDPTDLRDRFRIRYPELYAEAGYKLKEHEALLVEDIKRNNPQRPQFSISTQDPKSFPSSTFPPQGRTEATSGSTSTAIGLSNPPPPPAVCVPLPDELWPGYPDDYLYDAPGNYGDISRRPVTLSRNILKWNPSSTYGRPLGASGRDSDFGSSSGAPSGGMLPGLDGAHIDPRRLPLSMSGSGGIGLSHPQVPSSVGAPFPTAGPSLAPVATMVPNMVAGGHGSAGWVGSTGASFSGYGPNVTDTQHATSSGSVPSAMVSNPTSLASTFPPATTATVFNPSTTPLAIAPAPPPHGSSSAFATPYAQTFPPSTSSSTLSTLSTPYAQSFPPSSATYFHPSSSSSFPPAPQAQYIQGQAQPQLPNLVIPQVPFASARNSMRNLPRPAELLLGAGVEGAETAGAMYPGTGQGGSGVGQGGSVAGQGG
jgi:hypothetical protein